MVNLSCEKFNFNPFLISFLWNSWKKKDYKRDRSWLNWKQNAKWNYKNKIKMKSLNCVKWGNCFISRFNVCYFFCAWALEWHFHEKKEDGKYFSIFNENSCAKISGEFYICLVFNFKECLMPELEHHLETKKRIKDVFL